MLQNIDFAITKILKPIFNSSKKQFILINHLVKNWSQIVGVDYAKFCYPKTIKFGKFSYKHSNKKVQNQAQLVIAGYNSSIVFLLENSVNDIIEKIAQTYGFSAISSIRIVQEPKIVKLPNKKLFENLNISQQNYINKNLESLPDAHLKSILQDIAVQIMLKNNYE